MSKKYTFDSMLQFLKYHLYLKDKASSNELEIRFGTNKHTRISKLQYDNCISFLKSNNFTCNNETGSYILKIIDNKGPLRAEIFDLHFIQEFCISNDIQQIQTKSSSNVVFQTKEPVIFDETTQETVPPLDNKDFNFRIGYNKETVKTNEDPEVVSFIVNKTARIYRYINRISYIHKDYPVRVDFSIVKTKAVTNNKTIQECDLFNAPENYEIEIEVLNERISEFKPDELYPKIQSVLMIILRGIQNTLYPIKKSEADKILIQYSDMMNMKEPQFCGPSSLTLQLENLSPENNDNILTNYTVTDKADGIRKLLYISTKGRMYFITTNKEVQYTGVSVNNEEIFNTLIDGEHIQYDKNEKFINTYAAFDIYLLKQRLLTNEPLFKDNRISDGRYAALKTVIETIRTSISDENLLTLVCKNFHIIKGGNDLFNECENLFKIIETDEKYNYNTDGLIFTPSNLAVGARSETDVAPPPQKMTWLRSFKWKPVEYNTIDFLVTYPKDSTNNSTFYNEAGEMKKYRIINLRVGFSNKRHGYLNPFKDTIDGNFVKKFKAEDYSPALFYPTNPYDNDTHVCHIPIKIDEYGNEQMFTQEHEVFQDNMIVEFKYVIDAQQHKQWIPLKVRYDKTLDLRTSGKNFGNAYHVANSNWHSIHRPITKEILITGKLPPIEEDVYYNKYKKSKTTSSMRFFHNKIKSMLIDYAGTIKADSIMLDLAVGKGGDIRKWYYNDNIKFVLGIDVSKDNIENKIDGACKRYVEEQKNNPSDNSALFLHGDLTKNVKNGEAFLSPQSKAICDSIFGMGTKNIETIGKVAYNNHAIAKTGFNIVSCQFALHYFFKDKPTLKNFMINIVECTALNGIFIGTCYDGAKVFNLLKENNFTAYNDEELILNISKKYNEDTFPNNVSSLGYAIEIFQESINKPVVEYLVNFDFLIRIMENYGFVLEKKEQEDGVINSAFINSIDSFKNVHKNMNKGAKSGDKITLKQYEKEISYLNNYFIFRKVRNVNIEDVIWDEEDVLDYDGNDILENPEESKAKLLIKPQKIKLKIKK